jgi:hypothetical protein
VPKALDKDLFTLGKGFAEGHGGSRQTKVVVRSFPLLPALGKEFFKFFYLISLPRA